MHDGTDVGQLRVQIIESGADQRKFILPDSGNLRVGIDPDLLHDRIHRAQHNHAVNHGSGEIGRSHGQIDDKPLQERGAYCGKKVHPGRVKRTPGPDRGEGGERGGAWQQKFLILRDRQPVVPVLHDGIGGGPEQMVLKGNRGRVRIVARGFCGGLLKPVEGIGYRHIAPPLGFIQGEPARIGYHGNRRSGGVVTLIGDINQPHLLSLHILKGVYQFFIIEITVIIHPAAGVKDSLGAVEKEADRLIVVQGGVGRHIVGHA